MQSPNIYCSNKHTRLHRLRSNGIFDFRRNERFYFSFIFGLVSVYALLPAVLRKTVRNLCAPSKQTGHNVTKIIIKSSRFKSLNERWCCSSLQFSVFSRCPELRLFSACNPFTSIRNHKWIIIFAGAIVVGAPTKCSPFIHPARHAHPLSSTIYPFTVGSGRNLVIITNNKINDSVAVGLATFSNANGFQFSSRSANAFSSFCDEIER